jgi:hypothetical protein
MVVTPAIGQQPSATGEMLMPDCASGRRAGREVESITHFLAEIGGCRQSNECAS